MRTDPTFPSDTVTSNDINADNNNNNNPSSITSSSSKHSCSSKTRMTTDQLVSSGPDGTAFEKRRIHASRQQSMRSKYPFLIEKRQLDMTPDEAVKGLRQVVGDDCHILGPDAKGFTSSATMFNGAIQSNALAVLRPANAAHVSAAIKFCRQNNLSLSIKGGGSGVHGQSVAGDIIVDMLRMKDVSVSLPDESTTLADSFQQLSISRRPSLPTTNSSSSTVKRSADDGDAGGETKRRDLDDIREDSTGEVTSGSSRSGSGSSSESREGTHSTPDTSVQSFHSQQNAMDVTRAVSAAFDSRASSSSGSGSASGSGSGSGSGSSNAASGSHDYTRTTYVNPSPTAAGPFPFVPTPIGTSSSYAAYDGSFGMPPRMNINPDPPAYTLVTFGAGTHSKDLDSFTANSPYGAFHVPTSAFPVGAGQFLSGGFGFLGRKHGLAMDTLVEAEVVLADGRIVWVGQDKHSGEWRDDEDPKELWWGIRGAGATLGVVTRFRTKAFYVPSVFAGNFIYIFDRNTAPSLLRHVRDCVKGAPRTLYANIIMTAGPPGAPAIVVIQLCFSGHRSEGESYVQAISSWDGGRCLFQDFSERTFERQQVAVEEVLKGGYGKKWYIKSDMLKSLTDDVIDETCNRFDAIPDGCTWLFEFTGGGAQADVSDSCYPQSHREGMFTVAALHQWAHDEPPALDTRCVTTAEEWINEVIKPSSTGGPLPCFLQSAIEEDVRAVYGESFDRLVRLKRSIDPSGFFKHAMFTRSDGTEPDEWKQLPPLTEERVREMGKGKGKANDTTTSGTTNGNGNVDANANDAGAIGSAMIAESEEALARSIREHSMEVPGNKIGELPLVDPVNAGAAGSSSQVM